MSQFKQGESSTKSTDQFSLPSKTKSVVLPEMAESGLDLSTAARTYRSETDSTTTRLKRSPAMMLVGGEEQQHVSSTSSVTAELTCTTSGYHAPTPLFQATAKEAGLITFNIFVCDTLVLCRDCEHINYHATFKKI
ncbi:unnamed protein product [Gongylonema pulchrum]|uniref:Uncharacterized protein n=1 Tax=Gongylonema pulchrum TaxID=637853 RepID=A0A3P6SUJ7_9BILA|nr:unnamed protein product [Gongylonema pulchrum]